MKSTIAAFLSVVLAFLLGYLVWALLGIGANYSRNPLPLLIFAGVFLVLGGYAYRRWFFTTVSTCLLGLAGYAVVVGLVVANLGGTELFGFFTEWFVSVLAVTLLPWLVGCFGMKHFDRWRQS